MRLRTLMLGLTLVTSTALVDARDTKHLYSIKSAMNTPAAKEKLNEGVKFYFGDKAPKVKEEYGSYVSNRKTNAFNKSDLEACEWVFLSSMLALQERALNEGGDAVINIHSYYKKKPYHSNEKYECHAGAVMAGVALKGTVVKLK
ncbi:excinuclease ATPase subunit [Pseudomaricurvus alkylphenolicus]|uniref:excinuclease ATPase subunit n=1 Tax=Pseudomaricurvus alkylphenolicus TaxID=1306991 RepID=UPI001423D51B|nr:excinuclease ATPase subunit [Pseudomaricurvus alkylphenolicus]NIB44221.1 excinuclease ATPase subunit [Pseudomaricurvus alkylphenolicus]